MRCLGQEGEVYCGDSEATFFMILLAIFFFFMLPKPRMAITDVASPIMLLVRSVACSVRVTIVYMSLMGTSEKRGQVLLMKCGKLRRVTPF